MKPGVYVRVSTVDQHPDNQLTELQQYIARRGWDTPRVYMDRASGAKDRRPQLDDLLKAAKRREIDVVVVWSLDRLGRNLKHLLDVMQDLSALGVDFISLKKVSTRPPRLAGSTCNYWGRLQSSSVPEFKSASELGLRGPGGKVNASRDHPDGLHGEN